MLQSSVFSNVTTFLRSAVLSGRTKVREVWSTEDVAPVWFRLFYVVVRRVPAW